MQYNRIQKINNHADDIKENINIHNLNWLQLSNHPYRVLVFGGSGSGKANVWLNLIKQQVDDNHSINDKTYLYVKDPYEANY